MTGEHVGGNITIIGGGLAGCEAAWQAARLGGRAVIREMKPERFSPAHNMPTLAELVCSNSLKSDSIENAAGLLKAELRALDSLIIRAAEATRVPAGQTLAVDRSAFSEYVTSELQGAGVRVERGEARELPGDRPLVVATGPLTSDAFAAALEGLVGKGLNFYDAVAPIVYADSIDMERAFHASRYGKGGDDYVNCPLAEGEYGAFYAELLKADRAGAREFEKMESFEACMPIEAMAERGPRTLLFGPMRPVGLVDPRTGKRPFAVVQLRRENRDGTLYNLVGFQTRLAYNEQKRVFRMIPALERAEFARLGKLHRNSYLDSPRLLSCSQELRKSTGLFFAGQITGVEGYVESAMSGALAGINALRSARGLSAVCPPQTTISGALMRYVSGKEGEFSPMNANMGLLPHIEGKRRREMQAERAVEDFTRWADEALAT